MADHSSITDDCCPADRDPRIATHFDALTRERTAGGILPPMQPVSRRLYNLLADAADMRPTVLELGCGSGALAVALLDRGAMRYDGLDLSAESIAAARRRVSESGFDERSTLTVGDGARVELAIHDWVVMDRVICCYPDWDALLRNAVGAAASRIAFSVPTSRGLRGAMNRLLWGLEVWWTRIRPCPCPGYVHSLDRIERRLADAGFGLVRSHTGLMWYAAVWERATA